MTAERMCARAMPSGTVGASAYDGRLEGRGGIGEEGTRK